MSLTCTNLFWFPIGERMAIVRPDNLATDWTWQIVKRDDPSVVVDFGVSLIANATRHVFLEISSLDYDVDTVYELRILNDSSTVVSTGEFMCVRAAFGPDAMVDWADVNSEVKLALGLAGLNRRVKVTSHDPTTGIALREEWTLYDDESMSTVLAEYVLLRRLHATGIVIGEVMIRTSFEPSAAVGSA